MDAEHETEVLPDTVPGMYWARCSCGWERVCGSPQQGQELAGAHRQERDG